MTDRMRLTDDLVRLALTPADDGADIGLDAEIRLAVDQTEQRRYWWTPLRAWFGPLGPAREIRVAGALALLVLLLIAVVAVVGTRPRAAFGDGSMFHGGPARTGEMAGPGPRSQAAVLWQAQLPGPLMNTMPALAGGRLFVADGRGSVTVWDAATGDDGWMRSLPRPATSPAAANGILVVAAGDGVYGLAMDSGITRWQVASADPVVSSPAIVGLDVFVGFPDGSIASYELHSGIERWRTPPIVGAISRAVSSANALVFAGGDGGTFVAVRVTDGTEAWRADLGPGAVASAAVRDGIAYVASGLDADAPHVFFALDAATGVERWRFQAASGESLYVAAIGPELAYAVSLDGGVYALRDGTLSWEYDTGAPIGSVASLSGGVLYVSVSDGRVIALDAVSGAALWTVELEGDPGPTIPADRRLFVGTSLGLLVSIGEVP